jgi:DNA polymerase-4
VFRVFEAYTPKIERISIGEAFLDITGSMHLFGSPAEIAEEIRRRVHEETRLRVSVGATTRKFLSKIASQVAKPDGLIVVEPGKEAAFLHPLDVAYLWGVGPVTERRLHEFGLKTIGDIAETPYDSLVAMLGRGAGGHLYALANLQDPRPVSRDFKAKSVGAQSAIRAKVRTLEDLTPVLHRLVERVAERLRKKARTARTITVRVRFGDLSAVTRSATMPTPTAATGAITDMAMILLKKVVDEYPNHETSLVGISTTGLGVGEPQQLAMGVEDDVTTGGTPEELEYQALDASMDELRKRFGRDVVTHGSDLLSGRSEFSDGLSSIMTKDDAIPVAEDDGPVYIKDDE